ncbi:MAG TPA: M15 family metallopeptidase [Puia sp.]|nr:M15 family metallopeptidase [Puia sp.]
MGYKIIQRCNILLCAIIIFCTDFANAQNSKSSNQLHIINTISGYKEIIKNHPDQKMVSLKQVIPNIVLDLRYETKNNFLHRVMYNEKPAYTFMRLPAVEALSLVQKELNRSGYGIKIFDAYRPYAVTKKFWELVHDERYVANPAQGSGHNRGIAVDLTIIRLKTGSELKMPTGFDSFSDSAHHDFNRLPEDVLKNRKLLRETMEKYGFVAFATEWWHYSLPDPENYDVLDLSFRELRRN